MSIDNRDGGVFFGKYFGWPERQAIRDIDARLSALEALITCTDSERDKVRAQHVRPMKAEQKTESEPAPPMPRRVKMQLEVAASEGEHGWYPHLNGPSPISRNRANEVTDHQAPPQTRDPGWYWVKWRGKDWWEFGGWLSCGEWVKPNTPYWHPAPDVIGPRIQEPEQ